MNHHICLSVQHIEPDRNSETASLTSLVARHPLTAPNFLLHLSDFDFPQLPASHFSDSSSSFYLITILHLLHTAMMAVPQINMQIQELSKMMAHIYVLTCRDASDILGCSELPQIAMNADTTALKAKIAKLMSQLRTKMLVAIPSIFKHIVFPILNTPKQSDILQGVIQNVK